MAESSPEYMFERHIGLQKAILWEEAKGKLRALVQASGQIATTRERSPDYQLVKKAIEKFIKDFEDNGFEE